MKIKFERMVNLNGRGKKGARRAEE